jgi:DNA-binding winged helix-turn-helix (wHTH) protein/tetratricopeptide (TPR) repeat protein
MTEIGVREDAAVLTGRRWLFGPAVLDERTLELFVAGRQVELERKPLEVLLYLLHHAGEVVTKDDFAENLWPGRILTDTVLTRCISVLRQALQDDRTLIRTVHGYGYRLVARVKVEATEPLEPPKLEFKPGESPPLRAQWRLVERLGAGGHGEAWLARHEKTGDRRVFKFAVDANALTSLKREITLYRLMHDSLGARAAVARILEWNLEEPPNFIEMEHVIGGNLQSWSDAQGGAGAMPLSARIDLGAQIAEALAAAHSVGALHKDLKPGNVLVHVEHGRPVIKLCDFGSGAVVDPARLEALGITRLGFTKTLSGESATPLYLAPEVVAGQPFTVQADIYALGILLYQLVCGDLRRSLAPGWEADVEDELLREDIAAAAAGNPLRRLTDAAQLAERLRTLEDRRVARAAEAAAKARADRIRRVQEELRRMRVFAVLLCALAAAAALGGTVAYHARNDAVAASSTAEAVSGFLTEDVLRAELGLIGSSEVSYETLLVRAATRVDGRLKDQPAAAAKVHSLLGRRFQEIGQLDTAIREYEQAVSLFTSQYGEAADATLLTMDRLAWAYAETGQASKALAVMERLRHLCVSRPDSDELAMLVVRTRVARLWVVTGNYSSAEDELRSVIEHSREARAQGHFAGKLMKQWLGVDAQADGTMSDIVAAYANLVLAGNVLEEFGEYDEAESRLREAAATFSAKPTMHEELLALTHVALAVVLASAGDHVGAEASAAHMQGFFDGKLPEKHYARGIAKMALGRLRMEERRFAEGASLLGEALELCAPQRGCAPRIRAEFLWDLGRALNALGQHVEATSALRESLSLEEKLRGRRHPFTVRVRVQLADSLRLSGKPQDARAILAGIEASVIADLRPHQRTRADLLRVQGLLLLQTKDRDEAVAKLQQSAAILEGNLGSNHWRVKHARAELLKAERSVQVPG